MRGVVAAVRKNAKGLAHGVVVEVLDLGEELFLRRVDVRSIAIAQHDERVGRRDGLHGDDVMHGQEAGDEPKLCDSTWVVALGEGEFAVVALRLPPCA
jgi:hypothetical protein